MKIECIKDKIEDALNKVGKIAGKNTSLPVLAGLHISAEKNQLVIKATNLDLGVSATIPVKVVEPGSVVVPASTFVLLISSLPKEGNISISVQGQVLEVKTVNTETSINLLPSDDFPVIPEIDTSDGFPVTSRDFIFGLKSVIYSAAIGSIKPELSSISITYSGDHLVFAATDSFRLAEKKIRVKSAPSFKQILIPQKNALEIIRIFDKGEDELLLSIDEHQLALRSGGLYLTSRIVDGVFPDYSQIIPKETLSKAVLLKQDLISSLKTSLIFSDSFNQLTLSLAPSVKKFEVRSKNSTVGESSYGVEAVLEGEDMEINVNHKYFTDCFQSLSTDSLSLRLSGPTKPIVVEGVGDTSFLYIVMPMNRS